MIKNPLKEYLDRNEWYSESKKKGMPISDMDDRHLFNAYRIATAASRTNTHIYESALWDELVKRELIKEDDDGTS